MIVHSLSEPLPVTHLTAYPVGTTEMLLSWLRQSDYKSSYQYNVSVNDKPWIQSISETANVTSLIAGNNYTFTVQTVANGMSSDSVAISAFTGITIHILLKHLFPLNRNPLLSCIIAFHLCCLQFCLLVCAVE